MGIVKEFWSQYFILRNWSEYFDFKTFKPPSDFNGAVQRVKENFKHYFAHHIIIGLVFIVLIGLMYDLTPFPFKFHFLNSRTLLRSVFTFLCSKINVLSNQISSVVL